MKTVTQALYVYLKDTYTLAELIEELGIDYDDLESSNLLECLDEMSEDIIDILGLNGS